MMFWTMETGYIDNNIFVRKIIADICKSRGGKKAGGLKGLNRITSTELKSEGEEFQSGSISHILCKMRATNQCWSSNGFYRE